MPALSLVAVGAGEPAAFDLVGLFAQAHWIVKGVMVLLAVMLLVGVYIIVYKYLYVRRAARESAQFAESFWRSRDIEQIYKHAQMLRWSPVSQMFLAGYTELA